MLRSDELLTEDKSSLSNAVFHFTHTLTSDATAVFAMEDGSRKYGKSSYQSPTTFNVTLTAEATPQSKSTLH